MMKGLIAAASTILLFAAALQAEAGALMRRNPPVFPNTVYLIPNAESFGSDNDGGLNAVGQERAKCLPSVFANGPFPVSYVVAERAKEGSSISDAVQTVEPLASSLGITTDISCGRDDKDCVLAALTNFANHSSNAMLICWEVQYLEDMAEELGASNIPNFPDGSSSTIWAVQNNTLTVHNENCAGIDD